MNILDINTLPTLTLNVTGREGNGTSVTIINQESKDSIQSSNFVYTQGETLVVSIENQDFLDSIEQNTTLSVILYSNKIPLYRDVVRFRGELNTANEYIQYNNDDDYFVYEGVQYDEDDAHVTYGGEDVSGSTEYGDNTQVIGGDASGGTSATTPTDVSESGEYAVKYDLDNDGRGEVKFSSQVTNRLDQNTKNAFGDFKVRSAEYGTFNSSPTSLEEVTVYAYDFNSNEGNFYGYHPSSQSLSLNPDLVNTLERDFGTDPLGNYIGPKKYWHFEFGQDEPFNKTLARLQQREERSLPLTNFETTVFKEVSILDWTVGMSIYSDAIGTSITDNYVDSYANVNDLDRYHFISKNASGVWVLVRCTDGIVTHVESVEDTDYVKYIEMYDVSILSTPWESAPSGRLATTKAWVEGKLAQEGIGLSDDGVVSYENSLITIQTSNTYRKDERTVLDISNGQIGSVGSRAYRLGINPNVQKVYHEHIVYTEGDDSLLTASDEDRYTFKLLAPLADSLNNLEFYEQDWLMLEIDRATGLISDRAWITPQ
jgi:hypothetical protein